MYELRDGTKVDSLDTDVVLSTDPRNEDHLIGPVAARKLQGRLWKTTKRYYQGQTGMCVWHAIAHEIASAPKICSISKQQIISGHARTQKIDPYPNDGPKYGTDLNSACKILREMGLISSWKWMKDADDVLWSVAYRGPVLIVVEWPGRGGVLHCVMAGCLAINEGEIQGPNSWKVQPYFKFKFDHFRKIFRQGVIFTGRKC